MNIGWVLQNLQRDKNRQMEVSGKLQRKKEEGEKVQEEKKEVDRSKASSSLSSEKTDKAQSTS